MRAMASLATMSGSPASGGVASVIRMCFTSRMLGVPIVAVGARSGMRYSRQVAVRPCASRWVTPSRTW